MGAGEGWERTSHGNYYKGLDVTQVWEYVMRPGVWVANEMKG